MIADQSIMPQLMAYEVHEFGKYSTPNVRNCIFKHFHIYALQVQNTLKKQFSVFMQVQFKKWPNYIAVFCTLEFTLITAYNHFGLTLNFA